MRCRLKVAGGLHKARRFTSDRGSASLEFITAGVLLLVPLVYLVLVCGRVQAASLAAEGAVRQAARLFVTAESPSLASARAEQAVGDALADFAFRRSDARASITCAPVVSACLTSQNWVRVDVTVAVLLPFVPSILGLDKFARVQVSSSTTQRVAMGRG